MARNPRVHIVGDWDGAGVKRAQQDLGMFQRQAQGFSGAISKSMLGVGAAFGGAFAIGSLVGNAVDFLQDAAKAAVEDQKSVVALSKALENLGLAHSQAGVEDFISDLQLATGVADDQLRPAYQKLVTATGNVAKAQDLLNLSMDISAATGKDLASVSQAMSRASLGQVSALTRLGIPLDANIIKTKDFAAAQDVLTQKFGGQAAAAAETYEGKMRRLSTAVDEAKETIGYALVGALDDAASSFGGPDGIIPMVTLAGDVTADLVGGIGVLVGRLAELAAAGKDAATDGGNALGDSLSNASQMALTLIQFVPGLGQVAAVGAGAAGALIGLNREAGDTAEQLDALAESANGGDVALAKAALGMGATAKAAYDATVDMEALNDAIKGYLGLLSLNQARDDFKKSLRELDEALKDNARSFDRSAKGADENRQVLRSALGDAARLVQQMVDEGKISADEAERTFARMRRAIIDGFVREGFKRSDVRAFINAEGAWSPAIAAVGASVEGAAVATGTEIGKDIARGIPLGFARIQSSVNAAAAAVVRGAEAAARREAESDSPSLLFARVGEDLSLGVAKGVKDKAPEAVKAAADLIGKAVDGAIERIQSKRDQVGEALGAILSVSDGIRDQVLGNIDLSDITKDIIDGLEEGERLDPAKVIEGVLGTISQQRQAVSFIAGNIGTALPQELLSQFLDMDPVAAMALADYLGRNPEMLNRLATSYEELGTFTTEALGLPMGNAWAMVGGQSAREMLASAREVILDRKDTFAAWVARQLAVTIPVAVQLVGSSGIDVGHRAAGGPVAGGSPYIVGERGPELFVPSQSGSIVPNDRLRSGASVNVTVNAGMGADGYQIGQQVVDAIKKYERVAGPVFAAA